MRPSSRGSGSAVHPFADVDEFEADLPGMRPLRVGESDDADALEEATA